MKKTLGKIFLILGSALFIVYAFYSAINLIIGLVRNLSLYLTSYAAITSFAISILWIVIDVVAALWGFDYSFKNKNKTYVAAFSYVILILFIVNLVYDFYRVVSNGAWSDAWTIFSGLVYGGIAGVFYCLGYFLEAKKIR
jgi:hypothetical protein